MISKQTSNLDLIKRKESTIVRCLHLKFCKYPFRSYIFLDWEKKDVTLFWLCYLGKKNVTKGCPIDSSGNLESENCICLLLVEMTATSVHNKTKLRCYKHFLRNFFHGTRIVRSPDKVHWMKGICLLKCYES